MKKLPSYKELSSVFSYYPDSGELRWKKTVGRKAKKGDIIFSLTPMGYIRVGYKQKTYLAHRIIWKLVHKKDPKFIDHIDGDKTNNKIDNLRNVSCATNNRNKKANKRTKTGVSGIYYNVDMKKFHARFTVNNKRIHVGYFDTLEKAHEALLDQRKKHGYTERHGL